MSDNKSLLIKYKYLEGSAKADKDKKIAYILIRENYKKSEQKPNAPDYVGFINLKGIGNFYISLWQKERVAVKK